MVSRVIFKEVPRRFLHLFEKIKGDRYTLDNYLYIYRGIWTGVLRIFVINDEMIKEFNIEEGALKPVLRGKDIFPFYYQFNNRWVIYTNQKDFKGKYPNAIKYLSRYKTILERRGAVWIHGKEWWELEDPLTPEMFEVEKLVSPYTSNKNSFAYEEGKYYVMDSTIIARFYRDETERTGYIKEYSYLFERDLSKVTNTIDEAYAEIKPNTEDLKYLLALINSNVLEFYIKLLAPMVSKRQRNPPRGRFFLYIPPYPNILPVEISEKNVRIDIVKIVDKLSEISRRISEVESQDDSVVEELNSLEMEKNILINELNEVIFEIYEMDEEERTTIQSYILRKR